MCWEDKCLGCIKVETGSFIFAVINAVYWAMSTLGSIIGLIVVNVYPVKPYSTHNYVEYVGAVIDSYTSEPPPAIFGTLGNIVFSVLLIISLLNFMFAVFLCNGVNVRNTAHIKTYFVYGVVKAVLSSITVLILCVFTSAALILCIPIVLYCLILHMINLTLKKFSSGEVLSYQHKLLVTA